MILSFYYYNIISNYYYNIIIFYKGFFLSFIKGIIFLRYYYSKFLFLNSPLAVGRRAEKSNEAILYI